MQHVPVWEMLIVGAIVVLVLMWLRPGLRAAFEQSRQAKEKDWPGLLLPIAAVLLFVILLVYMVRK